MDKILTPQQSQNWQTYLLSKDRATKKKPKPTVAYAGTRGSYTEDATIKYFGEDVSRIPCRNFQDVFKSILGGMADYGVVPIENSTTGSVRDTLELLEKYDCYITGETQVKVEHCLLGVPGSKLEDITDIYAHEQSLMQCQPYLQSLVGAKRHPYVNNAIAAQFVKDQDDKHLAAIASRRAAEIHGLDILKEDINDLDINTTRFIIVADHPERSQSDNKVSLSFSVGHKPGALVRVLNIFDKYTMNLSKIESRPSKRRNWEYIFYIDIEGALSPELLDTALREVIPETIDFRYFGMYPSGL